MSARPSPRLTPVMTIRSGAGIIGSRVSSPGETYFVTRDSVANLAGTVRRIHFVVILSSGSGTGPSRSWRMPCHWPSVSCQIATSARSASSIVRLLTLNDFRPPAAMASSLPSGPNRTAATLSRQSDRRQAHGHDNRSTARTQHPMGHAWSAHLHQGFLCQIMSPALCRIRRLLDAHRVRQVHRQEGDVDALQRPHRGGVLGVTRNVGTLFAQRQHATIVTPPGLEQRLFEEHVRVCRNDRSQRLIDAKRDLPDRSRKPKTPDFIF